MNKPNGQFVITPAEVPAFLQTLPLAKIPGVGKVSAAKLEAMGLRTCGDVQKCDLVILLKRFGKFGRILWERSQGIDERDVNSERLRKSVGVERTMRKISTTGLNVKRLSSGCIRNLNAVWQR